MKLARYKLGDNAPAYGLIRGENIYEVKGDIFSEYAPTGNQYPLSQVKLLAPVTPSIIAAVGKNYYDHALEFDNTLPESPIIFFKPPTSVIGPEDAIVRPFISTRVDYEGELAMVVKKTARCVDAADYKDYILGYTILNDVTAATCSVKTGSGRAPRASTPSRPSACDNRRGGRIFAQNRDAAQRHDRPVLQHEQAAVFTRPGVRVHHPVHDIAPRRRDRDGHAGRRRPHVERGRGRSAHRGHRVASEHGRGRGVNM